MTTEVKSEKSSIQKEHENLINYAKDRRLQSRLPKYTQSSIEESVAKNHNCMKIDGCWVQLYFEKNPKYTWHMPGDTVLKELGMTKASFFKRFPDLKKLIKTKPIKKN